MLELLPYPPSLIPPPINLFVRLRPLCCGGQRVRLEYFEVDSCSTHTRLHLTAVLRKSLKECANGLSRCENVIDLIILSSSQIQGESSGLQCVCVCVWACLCLSHGFSVCVFLSIVFEVCFLSQYQKLLTLVYNGIFAKGISFLKAGADGKWSSDQPQWNKNQSCSLWALIRVLELFWNIPAYESLSLPDWKHPSRTDLYSSFLLMLSTIHKLKRESVFLLKFDERPN